MSLIFTARLITRGCRSQMLSINFNTINQKIFNGKYYSKNVVASIQKKLSLGKKDIEIQGDDGLELVYSGAMTKKVKGIKIFSLTTSLAGLLVQPFLLTKALETESVAAVVGVGFSLTLFTLVTPLLLHLVTRKYINDVYYNKKTGTYIASTYSLFIRPKKFEFTPEDVVKPELSQMLSNCYIKNKSYLLEFNCFIDTTHYGLIMGYNKPMDFKFPSDGEKKTYNSINNRRESLKLAIASALDEQKTVQKKKVRN